MKPLPFHINRRPLLRSGKTSIRSSGKHPLFREPITFHVVQGRSDVAATRYITRGRLLKRPIDALSLPSPLALNSKMYRRISPSRLFSRARRPTASAIGLPRRRRIARCLTLFLYGRNEGIFDKLRNTSHTLANALENVIEMRNVVKKKKKKKFSSRGMRNFIRSRSNDVSYRVPFNNINVRYRVYIDARDKSRRVRHSLFTSGFPYYRACFSPESIGSRRHPRRVAFN